MTTLAFGTRLRADPAMVVSAAVLAIVVVAAVAPGVVSTHDPNAISTDALLPPSWQHLFGTDQTGRDEFSRVVYGTRASLLIGFGAMAVGLATGAVLGVLAATGPRWLRQPLDRVTELLFSFPGMVLALLLIAVFGPSPVTLALAVGVGNSPGYARIVRAQVIAVTASEYTRSQRQLGHSWRYVAATTIAGNVTRPLIPLATLGVGQAIIWASALSFVGLGAQPPTAEWGLMLSNARSLISLAWWLTFFPGAAIALVSVTLTALGYSVQRALLGGSR
ncbi:ABC transporter permease [Mycobacterium yunnanensis]|uniref:ABC transporter permease n=1 Tax=Mycobacterium yunnanensis TaxID=368477 RepID=A0A9X3C4X6_9MYCO|nr:ABC transporter permease [Mycobacterium yunnanensis]MCV7423997.1 ABC transporter permease [Mycobacterium yunnanensis]